MAYLKIIPPTEITAGALHKVFADIEHAVNFLDKRNFPNRVPGSIIEAETLGGTALVKHGTPLNRLAVPQWYIPLCLPAQAFVTTSTAGADLGPYFRWNPSHWPVGEWRLEGTIYVQNASATATLELVGTAVIGAIQTKSTTAEHVESESLVMPDIEQNIWLKLKTSSASYQAGFLGARLSFAPS